MRFHVDSIWIIQTSNRSVYKWSVFGVNEKMHHLKCETNALLVYMKDTLAIECAIVSLAIDSAENMLKNF